MTRRNISLAFVGLLFLVALALVFSRAMRAEYGHDEDQFIASARVFADQALLPYKDYPYFHMPNLVFIYGLIYQFTSYNVLAARLFSVVCIMAALALLFWQANRFTSHQTPGMRLAVAAAVILLLLPNPLFAATSGPGWNHDLPVLLVLAAFSLYFYAARQARPAGWIFATGVLIGLAIGTRLSFATAIVPFLVTLFLWPCSRTVKTALKLVVIFSAGVLIALLPSLLLFGLAPGRFIFGNLGYAGLNTLYRQDVQAYGPMTAFEKLSYLWNEVISQPVNLLLFVLLIFLGCTPALFDLWHKKGEAFEIIFMLLLVPFITLGSLLPTPSWYHYFYAPVPFAILVIAYGLARVMRLNPLVAKWAVVLVIQVAVLSNLYRWEDYRRISFLAHPETWRPLMFHKLGSQVKAAAGEGNVLTLAPIFPMEGGKPIYPEFVTGPFAWRTAPYLDAGERRELGVISEDDLEAYLQADPPGSILVGFDPQLEGAFVAYAEQHAYREVEIAPGVYIWVR